MSNNKSIFPPILLGALIGFVNGFFGGGGGMIVVPLLTKYYSLKQKEAQATSIAIILPICLVSAIIYMFNVNLSFYSVLACGGGVAIGGTLGAFLLKGTNNKTLAFIFSFIMLIAGVKLIFF